MPLKHQTETALVGILGIAIALAGIVVGILSFVTSPWLLWIAAFFISLAYPLILYPHFRERRADYEFRLLHFVPAIILLVWLLFTILGGSMSWVLAARGLLLTAWALPLVAIAFALLAWFSLHVIRQWPRRLATLAAIFVPFAILGIFGEKLQWNTQLASLLDTGTGSSVSSGPIAANSSASSGIAVVSAGMSRPIGSSSSRAPQLPHAGGGIEFFALLVPAATSAAVHLRAMRRARA